MTDIAKSAEVVDEAARTASAIPQFTESAPLSHREVSDGRSLAVPGRPLDSRRP